MRTFAFALLLPAALHAADLVATPASFSRAFDAHASRTRLVMLLSPT